MKYWKYVCHVLKTLNILVEMPTNSTLVSKKLNIWQNLADMGRTYNNKVCEPIVDTSQTIWPLDQLENCLCWLRITNHTYHPLKYQNLSQDEKVIGGQREVFSILFFEWSYIDLPKCVRGWIWDDAYTYIGMFNTWSNLNKTRVCLEYVIYNKHCHIALKCRSSFKEGDYIMPTYHMAFMPSQPQPQVHLPLHTHGTPYARPNYPSEPVLFKQHGDSVDHNMVKDTTTKTTTTTQSSVHYPSSCVPNHSFVI